MQGVGIHTTKSKAGAGAEAGIPRWALGAREPAAVGSLPAPPPGRAAGGERRGGGNQNEIGGCFLIGYLYVFSAWHLPIFPT